MIRCPCCGAADARSDLAPDPRIAELEARAEKAEAPHLTDEWIAARWPDQDAAEIRRRFDALLSKLGDEPWKGMPRYPEGMQPVLAWAAMLPRERIETLTTGLALVPDHLRECKWVSEKPAFGEQRVKYEKVVGDNGHGMGRQAVAITPYVKGYNLAPWIAAASPGNVGALLAELSRLRAAGTFNEGIEAGAKWHDAMAKSYSSIVGARQTIDDTHEARSHKIAAKALRSLRRPENEGGA